MSCNPTTKKGTDIVSQQRNDFYQNDPMNTKEDRRGETGKWRTDGTDRRQAVRGA